MQTNMLKDVNVVSNLSEGELQTGRVAWQSQRQTSSFSVTETTDPDCGGVQVEIPGLQRE